MAIAEMETTDTSPNVIANEVSLADYWDRNLIQLKSLVVFLKTFKNENGVNVVCIVACVYKNLSQVFKGCN